MTQCSRARVSVRLRSLASASAAVFGLALGGALLGTAAHAADLCNNTNIYGVQNHPRSHQTTCVLTQTAKVSQLITYHWNNSRGSAPGSITLVSATTGQQWTVPAGGSSGQGGAPNVNWTANVNLTLPAGTYLIRDSDPATWSWNQQSGGNGFAKVEGVYAAAPAPKPMPGPKPGPNGKPNPKGKPKGGGGGGGGGGPIMLPPVIFNAPPKNICVHDSYYYTLHVRASDGSNTVSHVHLSVAPPGSVSATYDPASQTVSGVGLMAPGGTVTLTGVVEGVNEDIPFTVKLPVTVRNCPPRPRTDTIIPEPRD
ncbi:MAG: hypothetical protein ACHP84_03720 [Caulobacterales bacterium]